MPGVGGIGSGRARCAGDADLDHATRAGMDRQPEAMQLRDCGDQVETEAQTGRFAEGVGPIEPLEQPGEVRARDA